jgi:hypothetical protein
LAVTK